MNNILVPIISMGGLGAFFAALLLIADKKLKVEENPLIEKVHEQLPGANCGACGYPGCHQFAENLVAGVLQPTDCLAGGPKVAQNLAAILGIEIEVGEPVKARLRCLGGKKECSLRADYIGVKSCQAANLVSGGVKSCAYGCLGYGDCVAACPFGAITMDSNGLPQISEHCCTGCGLCVSACPRHLIELQPQSSQVLVGCSSPEKGKAVKLVCERGCIGCLLCGKVCPPQAITFVDNLPVIDSSKCDGCGICIEKCPTNSLLAIQVKAVQEKLKTA